MFGYPAVVECGNAKAQNANILIKPAYAPRFLAGAYKCVGKEASMDRNFWKSGVRREELIDLWRNTGEEKTSYPSSFCVQQ